MADNQTNETQGEVTGPQSAEPTAPEAAAPPAEPAGAPPVAAGHAPREREPRGRGHGRGERPGPADGLDEVVVKIYRCSTVVKGGRRFSFGALVVVGDRNGRVGMGYGKANEVPSAVEKGAKAARRNMIDVKLAGSSIPHPVLSKYRASKVKLIPAGEGTGVIAGASVRAVMELAGVKDVLTKVYGSTSPKNLVKAAFEGLASLRTREDIGRLREVAAK